MRCRGGNLEPSEAIETVADALSSGCVAEEALVAAFFAAGGEFGAKARVAVDEGEEGEAEGSYDEEERSGLEDASSLVLVAGLVNLWGRGGCCDTTGRGGGRGRCYGEYLAGLGFFRWRDWQRGC